MRKFKADVQCIKVILRSKRGLIAGTWIPLERGIELSAKYKVDHLLGPIIRYIPSSTVSPLTAPKIVTAVSTKPRTVPQRQKQGSTQNPVPIPSRPSLPRQTKVPQKYFPKSIYDQHPAYYMTESDEEQISEPSDTESDGSSKQSSHSRSISPAAPNRRSKRLLGKEQDTNVLGKQQRENRSGEREQKKQYMNPSLRVEKITNPPSVVHVESIKRHIPTKDVIIEMQDITPKSRTLLSPARKRKYSGDDPSCCKRKKPSDGRQPTCSYHAQSGVQSCWSL
jgi:hypothetical protein